MIAEEQPPSSFESQGRKEFWAEASREEWEDFRWQIRNSIRTVAKLGRLLRLSEEEKREIRQVAGNFRFSITPYYFTLMNPLDASDPIRRQAVPSAEETKFGSMGEADPLGELGDLVTAGLIHRYPDRVLLVATNVCATYCRHCTRKRIWKSAEAHLTEEQFQQIIAYLESHREIREVVISGGDPLVLPMWQLEGMLRRLRAIPHVEILRIGTRVPVVLPMRVDDELCRVIERYRPIWLNTQFNHPREITPEAAMACERILKAGVPVNNQSVLLAGVNDRPEVMIELCQGLLKIGARPYYLFQCDPVVGAEHLRTSVWTGIDIVERMRGHISGLAIPTFVVDAPEGGGKIPLQPNYLLSMSDEEIVLRNYEGRIIRYRNPRSQPTSALSVMTPDEASGHFEHAGVKPDSLHRA